LLLELFTPMIAVLGIRIDEVGPLTKAGCRLPGPLAHVESDRLGKAAVGDDDLIAQTT